ncbi:MAG: toxin-antitoxin system YwqK family antitoxin [Bacteroidetes bacterium]|nr:toxin-antitoxin system YwqK family antitoxin [Bacteroidota bacterium]MBS1941524.1 toxin-antitoxin system YwqK family antitoxin [Bacteroidota bacterium]
MRPISSFPLLALAVAWFYTGRPATAQAGPIAADTINQVDAQGLKQGWWRLLGPVPDKPDYQAGNLYEEGRYADSKRTGIWKRYWPNGRTMSEVTYVKGLPKGTYSTFYPDGRPEEQGSWDMDRNTGGFKRWYSNGNLMQEFVFDPYGMRNGVQKYYHENGNLEVSVNIEKGREEGTLKRYYPNGDVQETAEYHGGDEAAGSFRSYKPKAAMVATPLPAEAKPAPALAAGESPNSSAFKADGWNVLYNNQHRISQQGQFRKGRLLEGKVYKYDRNGILYKVEVYVNGRYVGKAQLTEDDQ